MRTATIRELRTHFPRVRKLIEQEGEVVVTDRGRPVVVMRPYEKAARGDSLPMDYYGRLRRRMPRPLAAAARKALEEATRGER